MNTTLSTLNRYFLIYPLFFLTFTFCQKVNAQEPKQVTETENKIQEAFLAAKLESISGHNDKAFKILDSLSREYRNRSVIYFEMAKLHLEEKNYNAAVEKLDKALAIEKDNFWYLEKMAVVQTELKALDKAIDCYMSMIRLKPKSSKYYDEAADLLLLSNKHKEAIELLQKKEMQNGFSEYNSAKIFDIAMDIQQYNIAEVEIEKLLQKKQPKLQHLKMGVKMYKKSGNTERVRQLQEKIIAIDPNDVEVMLDKMEKDNGIIDETSFLISLQPLMQNRSIPTDSKILELLPFVETHAKNPKVPFATALINLCEILANIHPGDAKVHAMYGDVLMNDKKEVQAIRQYQRTLEINKNNFLVWEQLMYGLESIKDMATLGKTAEQAINYFPNQAISYYFAALSYLDQNNVKLAKEYKSEAFLIAGKNPVILSKAYFLDSKIAFSENKMTEAHKAADQSITLSNEKWLAPVEWKGDMLLSAGNKPEARIYFQKALSLVGASLTLEEKISKCQ
jgi:tetratricopeptide (TPR) repeat protein